MRAMSPSGTSVCFGATSQSGRSPRAKTKSDCSRRSSFVPIGCAVARLGCSGICSTCVSADSAPPPMDCPNAAVAPRKHKRNNVVFIDFVDSLPVSTAKVLLIELPLTDPGRRPQSCKAAAKGVKRDIDLRADGRSKRKFLHNCGKGGFHKAKSDSQDGKLHSFACGIEGYDVPCCATSSKIPKRMMGIIASAT